jgi:glycosyltransferase involved in cell wall biosynthesis
MKILFLTQVLPYPLDAGPKVRAYYVLRYLAQQHKVTLASFVRASDTAEAVAHLRDLAAEVITVPMPRARWRDGLALARSLASGEPLLITRDDVPEMRRALRGLVGRERFDRVHADQLWMAPYALAARAMVAQGGSTPKTILDQHNAVFVIPRRLAGAARNPVMRLGWQREARQMAAYERRMCRAFDAVVTVTPEDRELLQGLYANGQRPDFPVIPICVDPGPMPGDNMGRDVLFVGGMHWPPNAEGVAWFAREALPRLLSRQPGTRFVAVGKSPPAGLGEGLPAGAVQAPGYVDETEPYWRQSRVFVVPLLAGGGMRVKILDAWARGMPVVSTTVGAEGLAYTPGEDILIADDGPAFAEAVAQVLADDGLARRLAAGGRRTVEQGYAWRRVYPAWDVVYAADEGRQA